MKRNPKSRGFWKTDEAIGVLVRVLAGDLTTAQAAEMLGVSTWAIYREKSDVMRALDAYYVARNEPNHVRALMGLNENILALYERIRKEASPPRRTMASSSAPPS
jgi:hypothetical protein